MASASGEFRPIRVVELELADGLREITEPGEYREAFVCLRLDGQAIGTVRVSYENGRVTPERIERAIAEDEELSLRLARASLRRWLLKNAPEAAPSPPTSTVVICTRDRPDDLRRCLESLLRAHPAPAEIIVVDNDPPDDTTRELVKPYPVRYALEPRRGLDAARRLGASLASGEIVVFTDDDVVVDPGWLGAMLAPFETPRVGAVTGLTLPLELETEAQLLFERYGGHGRGFEPIAFDQTVIPPAAAGHVGSGANMAFRRELIRGLELFARDLDAGAPTLSGGDTYAFYRVLVRGYQIAYRPDALVWHRHRRDRAALRELLYGYNVGGFSFLLRCWLNHGDWAAPRIAASWLLHHHCKHLARWALRRPRALTFDLLLYELLGALASPIAYLRSLLQVSHNSSNASPIPQHASESTTPAGGGGR